MVIPYIIFRNGIIVDYAHLMRIKHVPYCSGRTTFYFHYILLQSIGYHKCVVLHGVTYFIHSSKHSDPVTLKLSLPEKLNSNFTVRILVVP